MVNSIVASGGSVTFFSFFVGCTDSPFLMWTQHTGPVIKFDSSCVHSNLRRRKRPCIYTILFMGSCSWLSTLPSQLAPHVSDVTPHLARAHPTSLAPHHTTLTVSRTLSHTDQSPRIVQRVGTLRRGRDVGETAHGTKREGFQQKGR
jgi:hypothetical protein